MPNAQSCLTEIELLANDTSSEKRHELLHRVTDLFFLTRDQHTPADALVFGDVMGRIAYELEIGARTELSQRLCETDQAPHQLVCELARDEIEVATPVLERSPVLTEVDLVKIAKTQGQPHLRAIAKRATVSAPVTDVIIERGESGVLAEIAGNKAAELTNAGITILLRKACTDDNVRNALAKRGDLLSGLMHDIETPKAGNSEAGLAAEPSETNPSDRTAPNDGGVSGLNADTSKSGDEKMRECLKEIAELCASVRDGKSTELLDKIADLYFITAGRQSVSERAAFGGLMVRLAKAVDPIVRARLAERFAFADTAPINLLRKLSRDEISVARPILQYSSCLPEGDLVSIACEARQEHLLAAAHRYDLTASVTDMLVRRGEKHVHQAILHNVSAELSAESVDTLKQAGEDDEIVQRVLRMRGDIASNPIGRLRRLSEREFRRNGA